MKKVAIVGAGIMGTSIAQRFLMSSYLVELIDIQPDALQKAYNKINLSFNDALSKGIIDSVDQEIFIKSLSLKSSIIDISKDVDLIIEAATEDIKIKEDIFNKLEKICPKNVIFATNTSCLSISNIAIQIARRDKFIGMHFFYPAERNKLLEIVPSRYTSQETLSFIYDVVESIDKIAITVKDKPGFCVNRFFVPYMNEAVKLLESNVADIYTINYAAKDAFKAPFGPFEIMNLTGTSLAYSAISELYDVFRDFYKPANLLEKMAANNTIWDLPAVNEINDKSVADLPVVKDLQKHFQGVVFGICANLVEEEISSVSDINIGAKIGLGWKKPPFEIMNEFGPSKVNLFVDNIVKNNPSFPVGMILDETDYWTIHSTKYFVDKGVAKIKLWRPQYLNALNEQLFLDLDENLDKALEDNNVKLITIEGVPKVFSSGADIRFFIQSLKTNDVDQIIEYTELAHSVLNKLDKSPKPVVACVDGIAFGGGLELALCADFIIATERSSFQFPELAIDIFPGFGGTQRLPRKIGVELARYLILFGEKISADSANEYGLIDKKFSNIKDLNQFIISLGSDKELNKDNIVENYKDNKVYSEETQKTIKILRNIDLLISKKLISKRAKKLSGDLENKSARVINIINELINLSKKLSVEDGLKKEFSYIKEVFENDKVIEKFEAVFNKK